MFLIFLFLVLRLQDTPLHTRLQTADGTKPPAALKAARPRGPHPAAACGTPHPATHLQAPPLLAGTRPATPRQATAGQQEASARTAGTRPRRQRGRPPDTAAAGPKRHEPTEGTSRWARRRPRGPVRGSLGGMKRPPVRWDPQRRCSLLEKLPSERRL